MLRLITPNVVCRVLLKSLVLLVSLVCVPIALLSHSPEPTVSAQDFARQIVQNEIKASKQDDSHWSYQKITKKPGKTEERIAVETRSGDLDRLVSLNGEALSGPEQAREHQRIQKLLHDPSEQRREQQDQQKDSQKMDRMLRLLPEAWLFRYGSRRDHSIQLLFSPNPSFHPDSRETHVLNTVAGEMWVDSKEKRIVEISGHLVHRVNFVGGIGGHLDSGGRFEVRNIEVAPLIWRIVDLNVHINGKALFFKTISIQQTESRSHFRRVPDDLSLAQAAQIISGPAAFAESRDSQ